MSVPNFSSLAGLEVAEKFVCVWGGVGSKWFLCLTPTLVALELSWVTLGFDNTFFTFSGSLKICCALIVNDVIVVVGFVDPRNLLLSNSWDIELSPVLNLLLRLNKSSCEFLLYAVSW